MSRRTGPRTERQHVVFDFMFVFELSIASNVLVKRPILDSLDYRLTGMLMLHARLSRGKVENSLCQVTDEQIENTGPSYHLPRQHIRASVGRRIVCEYCFIINSSPQPTVF